ncbi:MAG: hypothetical protein MZW92_11660 [Comamonadaceae bacterium]|nr:hypothetical protein [Comamonadaceae bacterium]
MQDLNASTTTSCPTTASRCRRPIPTISPPWRTSRASPRPILAAARILEIGCAEGANLLPIAFYWPQTRMRRRSSCRAFRPRPDSALIAASGAANCRILHADLSALPADFGEFDYIDRPRRLFLGAAGGAGGTARRSARRHLAAQRRRTTSVSMCCRAGVRARPCARDLLRARARASTRPPARVAAARRVLERTRGGLRRQSGCAAHPDLAAGDRLPAATPRPPICSTNTSPRTMPPKPVRGSASAPHATDWPAWATPAPACATAPGRTSHPRKSSSTRRSGTRFRRALLVHAAAPRRARGATSTVSPVTRTSRSDEEIDLGSALPQDILRCAGRPSAGPAGRASRPRCWCWARSFRTASKGRRWTPPPTTCCVVTAMAAAAPTPPAAAAEWQELLAAQAVVAGRGSARLRPRHRRAAARQPSGPGAGCRAPWR